MGFGSSLLADQVFFLSLTWAAVQRGSPSEVGLVLAAGSLPRLCLLLVGGVLADRASPKRIIIGTDAARAVVIGVGAAVLMFGSMSVWGLIVVALAIGALDGLFLPAVGALPALITPTHLLGRVAALRTVVQRTAMLVGGPLAGWLIYLYGSSAAFAGSAVLFAVSVCSLALVVTPMQVPLVSAAAGRCRPRRLLETPVPPARGPASDSREAGVSPARTAAAGQLDGNVWARLRAGFGGVRHHPVLPWLLLLIAGMNFGFAGPVTAGIPLLAAQEQWGARGAGLLLGGFGLGAAVSGLGLVVVPRIPHAGRVAMVSVAVMGAALAGMSVGNSLPAVLTATVVLGLASGVFGTVVHALVLTSTPKQELGRVMGLVSLSIEGVVPLSFAAAGALAGYVDARTTFLVGGGVILASTAIAFSHRHLRSLQLPASTSAERADRHGGRDPAEA